MNINKVLELAPAKICEYAEQENKAYEAMIFLHEDYKQQRASLYLEMKGEGGKTIPEIDASLDIKESLVELKARELDAEVQYRAWRIKKNKAQDVFQAACEQGRNIRAEMKSLGDTITEGGK